MDGIDNVMYMRMPSEKFKSEKNKHSAGLRVYGGSTVNARAVHGFGS